MQTHKIGPEKKTLNMYQTISTHFRYPNFFCDINLTACQNKYHKNRETKKFNKKNPNSAYHFDRILKLTTNEMKTK